MHRRRLHVDPQAKPDSDRVLLQQQVGIKAKAVKRKFDKKNSTAICMLTVAAAVAAAFAIYNPQRSSTVLRAATVNNAYARKMTKAQFSQFCNWTTLNATQQQAQHDKGCNAILHLLPTSSEGISRWTVDIVMVFLTAILTTQQQYPRRNCTAHTRLVIVLDYGEDVDIDQVLSMNTISTIGSSNSPDLHGLVQWMTLPAARAAGIDCSGSSSNCIEVSRNVNLGRRIFDKQTIEVVPDYRNAYTPNINRGINYKNLQKLIPGFTLENGMRCIFDSLFQLSPEASKFQPNLFTEILPTMHDPKRLVTIGVYLRTFHADDLLRQEQPNLRVGTFYENLRRNVNESIDCALEVENMYRNKATAATTTMNSSIIWMVVTDSPNVKEWIKQEYGMQDRIVLTTNSRGVHTRTARHPTTADFAEALIDWYLIGEPDVVVLNGLSFGQTAAARTNRHVYLSTSGSCLGPALDIVGRRVVH